MSTRSSRSRLIVSLVALIAVALVPSCRLVVDPHWWDLVGGRDAEAPTVEVNVAYGPHTGCSVLPDVYCGGSQELDVHRSPVKVSGARPVLVWIHGGGWGGGDKAARLPSNVAVQLQRGYDIVSINYRLAPWNRYPAALHDVKLVLRWIASNAAERGWDPGRVVLIGHSAGGHLATLAAATQGVAGLEPPAPAPQTGPEARVAGAVSVNGVLDLRDSSRRNPWVAMMVELLIGCGDCVFSEWANPGRWADQGDPPMYLVTGKDDPFVSTSHAVNTCIGAAARSTKCSIDVVDSGPTEGQGHVSWPSLNQTELESFLDDPAR